jgi:hypothetical protein
MNLEQLITELEELRNAHHYNHLLPIYFEPVTDMCSGCECEVLEVKFQMNGNKQILGILIKG